MATEQEKADLSKKRGQAAASITDPVQRQKFIAAQGEAEQKGKGSATDEQYEHLNREAEDTMATGGLNKAVGVPSYKHGTAYVPKTGPAILHEGERVVSKEENATSHLKAANALHTAADALHTAADAHEEAPMEHSPEEKAHFARSMHKLHGGALHKHFGIPEDQPIPMEKKQEAANSDNPHVAAMGRMAVAMHGWKHPGKK